MFKKKLHRVQATGGIKWFSFQSASCMLRGRTLRGIMGAEDSNAPSFPISMKRFNVEMKPPTM